MHPLEGGPGWGQPLYSHSEVSGAIRGRHLGSTADSGCCRVVGKDWLALRKGAAEQRSVSLFSGFCPSPRSPGEGGVGSPASVLSLQPGLFPVFHVCALSLSELPLSPFSIFLISTFHCYSLCSLLQASLTQWASSETTNDRMQ